MGRPKSSREEAYGKLIKVAFDLFVEARKEVPLYGFQEYIRDHMADIGNIGFVESIGQAIIRAVDDVKRGNQ